MGRDRPTRRALYWGPPLEAQAARGGGIVMRSRLQRLVCAAGVFAPALLICALSLAVLI